MRSPCFILLLVFWCGTSSGQTDADPSGGGEAPSIVKGPSDEFRYHVGVRLARPNVELPPHIEAKEGELTFLADFENPGENGLPLYLINRTGKVVSFPSQDNDLYVRLEYLNEDGIWVRAQTHRNSWCGNSYYSVELLPGQHFQFTGYRPAGGTPAKVRYRSEANRLTSEIGDGFFLEADRKAAALDDMAADEIPSPLGWMLRAEESFPYGFPKTDSGYLFALELLSHYSESAYYRNEAAKKIEALGEDSPLTPKLREILARDWPAPGSVKADALAERCLEHIERDQHPEIAWNIISFMLGYQLGNQYAISPTLRSRIAAALAISLDRENEWETRNAAEVIANPGFTNEYIGDDSLLKWLHSEEKAVVVAAANALAIRHRINDLVQIGSKLPDDKPFLILNALASGGKGEGSRTIQHPGSKEERAFWESCFRKDTFKAVQHLPQTMENWNPYNRLVQGPVKDYLEQVAARMGSDPVENEDLYSLSFLVRFFGKWQMEENVPVLQALLKHPEYIESDVSSSTDGRYLRRDYRVRADARTALMKMGVSVNPEIVVEEKIPLQAAKTDGGASSEKGDPFQGN